MPLDHYISQVHLKRFYSPALGNRLYAIRKSDLRCFTPNSRSICRIRDGSTNAYLREDRAIEKFLETIEPNYNSSLEKLRSGKIDRDCIYTISGFAAFVIACSPTARRLFSDPLKSIVTVTAAMMDEKKLLSPSPPEFSGLSLTELLRSGEVKVAIDSKFPQALGISSILNLTTRFGNNKWEILHNNIVECPFFTSDFPTAIEVTDDLRVLNRIVPLAPDLAIRIRPNLSIEPGQHSASFDKFEFCKVNIRRADIVRINRLIVRCAEDMVFYRDDRPWVRPFVVKNRRYRIQPITREFSGPGGTNIITTQRIVASVPREHASM